MKQIPPPGCEELEQALPSPHPDALFSALLTPHRSLAPQAFLIMMILIALFSFVAGVYFMTLGAWPVMGFFGLDVLAIYYAFKLNYRSGRVYELVSLFPDRLEIMRVAPGKEAEVWSCNPYWARLKLKERRGRAPELSVQARGDRFVFGEFLIPDEKEDFVKALQDALRTCQ